MSLRGDVDEYYTLLDCNRVLDRKKACEKIQDLLENNPDIIKILDEGKPITWNELLEGCERCLRRDAEKVADELKKKDVFNLKPVKVSKDLFQLIIKTALKKGDQDPINVSLLIEYIDGSLREKIMKRCYEDIYLITLRDILSDPKCRGHIESESENWLVILNLLKNLLLENSASNDSLLKYQCFMLLIKYGPVCALAPSDLREQFDFITKLCQLVTSDSPRLQQEHLMEIVLDFCKHTAEDNKVSCCKFGEVVLSSLMNLYEPNGRESKIKVQLVEFLLLQVTIHHPYGVGEGNKTAHADNWSTWKICLKKIYHLLNCEISFYFKNYTKNVSFFIPHGKSTVILDSFVALFVEVARQLIINSDMDCSMPTGSLSSFSYSQAPKKQKIEVSLKSFISQIQETKSWVWIKLVSSIIKTYPDLLDEEMFLNSLRILQTMQVDFKDSNVMNNVYGCQKILLAIQEHLHITYTQLEIQKLWKLIGESTFRAVGLNQNVEATQNLLQKLILRRNIIELDAVIQTYTSGVVNITEYSMKTLEVVLENINFSQLEQSKKVPLIKCILNTQNLKDYKYLLSENTAKLLVAFTLKQWPSNEQNTCELETTDKYKQIKDIYLKSSFEKDFFEINRSNRKAEELKKTFAIDFDVLKALLSEAKIFANNSSEETLEKMLSIILLLLNILCYMTEYAVMAEKDIKDCDILRLIENWLKSDRILKDLRQFQTHDEKLLKNFLAYVGIFELIFSIKNEVVATRVKNLIPLELLKNFFEILQFHQQESKKRVELQNEVRKALTKTLSGFCCMFGNGGINTTQENIMAVLARPDYDFNREKDIVLCVTFLEKVKRCKAGFIPDSILADILDCLTKMCKFRYRCYDNVIDILTVLNELYPHVAVSKDNELKSTAVCLLFPFFKTRHNYGPNVSLVILDCIKTLCQVDPRSEFSIWEDEEISKRIPIFLCSDYQKVRFKAIETLITFFEITSKSKRLQDFHKQEEIFSLTYNMSLKVFEVTGQITEERRIDECVMRTASVMHTFSCLMLSCNSWIEDSILTLIKLEHHKNIGLTTKILSLLEKHFSSKTETNYMEKYLENIIGKWLTEGYKIDDFQFKFFDCTHKIEFYAKYYQICVPLLIETDRNDIIKMAQQLGMNEKEILEKTCTKIFGRLLCENIENVGPRLLTNSPMITYLKKIIGEVQFKDILVDHLDKLLLSLLSFITDEKYIHDQFDENVIFLTKKLSHDQFLTCLNFIQSFLCDNANIILFLTEKHLRKVEQILLSLKLQIYNNLADDKLKCFHRYTIFLNLILQNLHDNSHWQFYFIKDTIYSLIHTIQNHSAIHKISSAACKYLYTFLRKILPGFANAVENFLIFTVNSLKIIAITNSYFSVNCIKILRFLIVDNACHFMNEIEKLDAFPRRAEFEEIRNVHNKIKYGNSKISLEEEIKYFLEYKDISTRQDSLIHLRGILSKEKKQLKELCDKLQEIRGFSEDCENSLLHRLICMLVKMSCFHNENVSSEAIKCLGELGPIDLMTLVLQPEKSVVDANCSAFELFSRDVVSLLSEYVFDIDINVVKTASEAFYAVLNSKEGRKVSEFDYGVINKKYITPYIPLCKSSPASHVTVNKDMFSTLIDNDEIWYPKNVITHKEWIVTLVTSLLKSFADRSFLNKLIPICKVKTKFCEQILPSIVYLLLCIKNNNEVVKMLSLKINGLFVNHWNFTVKKTTDQNLIVVNKKSVKCMLDVVNFMRLQKSFSETRMGNLKVNHLPVAKAAEFCAAHFTALLFSELWCQESIKKIENNKRGALNVFENGNSALDVIYENEHQQNGETLHNIFRSAYKAIGDLDALPGCGISHLLKPQFRVEHYKELGQWDQVTHYYEMQTAHGCTTSKQSLLESLKRSSLYQIPILCSPDKPQYDCLWRLGQWNTGEKTNTAKDENVFSPLDYEKYKFYALKAICDKDKYSFDESKKLVSLCTVDNLRHTSLESSKNLYPLLTDLQSLIEMEDFSETSNTEEVLFIIKKWKQQDDIVKKNDFRYVEPIVAQRFTMLTEYVKVDGALKNILASMILDFADYAKMEGYTRVATSAVSKLQYMSDLNEDIKSQIQFREAQLAWSNNDKLVARHILSKLSKNEDVNPRLRSMSLKLLGQYMVEAYSENRLTILDHFFQSLKVLENTQLTSEDNKSTLDTYDKIASFADREYQQKITHMKSDLFQRKVSNMKKIKEMAKSINEQNRRTTDERKAALIHEKQSTIDQIEIENTKKEKDNLLAFALKYYLKNLLHSDINNIKIFRVMSLFLENKDNPSITAVINKYLTEIPSYKYIAMLPQLIPHISESTDLFSKHINNIVEQCAIHHPHHTLPLLLSLANSNKDREFTDSKTKTSSNDSRILTSTKMLTKLKRNKDLSSLIDKLQSVSQALIDLAYYQDPSTDPKKDEFHIPSKQKITKIRNFDDVLVPTYNLKVSKTNTYNNIVGIIKFNPTYNTVGGINAPKRIVCHCTDGKSRLQLVKGHDDLRQDAVMQQVFTIMNSLLAANKQTRNLLIRTYKIVPLSMRSGVLEWVDNSMPIGEYLVGRNGTHGAHTQYRPVDASPNQCRITFKKAVGRTPEQKLQIFKDICKDFKPVFHKFFESSFPQPTIWYERRRAYIHSVATTSMCGYILGIGDRHVNNILIDKRTAEVIHIDFGIAFEQGRCLPTPETVPFRLTRDVVDGMGISGVEGIFRRSCEKTMEVLRQNSQTIITILEVLLYDPLYAWTVSPAEANKRQTDDDDMRELSDDSEEDNTNITAERALLRLRGKLQGTEEGNPTSIEHQVGTLIQQAMDPANLSRLFHGWQPYL